MFSATRYEEEHGRIWDAYRKKYAGVYNSPDPDKRSTMIIDGAINPKKYDGIVYLLKEAYVSKATDETWDICEELRKEVKWSLWHRVSEWTCGLQKTTLDTVPRFNQWSESDKFEALQTVGLVNVKKVYGVKNSDDTNLLSVATENQDLLRSEIEVLQPRIIVCGNTSQCLNAIFDCHIREGWNHCDNWYYRADLSDKLKNVTVLDYFHPAARYPALLSYYGLTNIYQQSLKDG